MSQLTQVVDKISIPSGGITKGPGFLLALSYSHLYIPEAVLNSLTLGPLLRQS